MWFTPTCKRIQDFRNKQNMLKKQKDESASLRNMGKEFGSNVRSEAELDAAIEAMESTIAHESMSLGEEKNRFLRFGSRNRKRARRAVLLPCRHASRGRTANGAACLGRV